MVYNFNSWKTQVRDTKMTANRHDKVVEDRNFNEKSVSFLIFQCIKD